MLLYKVSFMRYGDCHEIDDIFETRENVEEEELPGIIKEFLASERWEIDTAIEIEPQLRYNLVCKQWEHSEI